MNLIEKYNLSFSKIAKILGLVLLAGVVLSVALMLISSVSNGLFTGIRSSSIESAGYAQNTMGFGGASKSMDMDYASPSLSLRNVTGMNNSIVPKYEESYAPGNDAENFEVTEYSATIETRKIDKACDDIMLLKGKDYIIFESSNKEKNSCNFRFKVKKQNAEEVLTMLRSLNPRNLNENIETVKKQIDDFTSQEEILKKKLATMEDTLSSAITSYDELSKLSTDTRNAESLASVIKSKIEIIERLSQEKINVSSQLENISRMKAEKLDKLEYTYFNVNIYENKYIDVDGIKDSWKQSVKTFVFDMNNAAQDLSLGLIRLIVIVFQYLLYLLIIVITAKYVWKLFKAIWQK